MTAIRFTRTRLASSLQHAREFFRRDNLGVIRKRHLVVATLILLIATFFNDVAFSHAERFHPDEAFYMTIARNAAIYGDWWLISEPLDKPPLTYYANALSLTAFALEPDIAGVLHLDIYRGEFAGRLFSWWSSLLLVAVMMALVKRLTNDWRSAIFAGLLVALSPLRIVFAATAFTDMPMLFLALLALWLAARGRPMWAGIWFALSLIAKPQSIFLLPLLLLFTSPLSPLSNQKGEAQQLGAVFPSLWRWGAIHGLVRFFLPILIIGCVILLWDVGRVAQGGLSFWQLGQARYTPTTLTLLPDYPARLATLWATLQYTLGNGWLTAGLMLLGVWQTLRHRAALQLWLLLWLIGFVGVHVVFTLNLFDRNLLVVLPVLAILISLPHSKLTLVCRDETCLVPTQAYSSSNRVEGYKERSNSAILILSILLLVPAWQASTGQVPIGGDRGEHTGIDELAQYLNSKPVATVIYDRWLDWELDYYMGEWTNKRRVFYPTPDELMQGALALDEVGVRYWVAPQDIPPDLWLDALREAEFEVWLDTEIANFAVYGLQP